MREISERETGIADLSAELADFLVGQLEEVVEYAELVENLECGWMNGVAAKVAKEIGVFLEYANGNAGACEEKAQHHTRRASASHQDLQVIAIPHAYLSCRSGLNATASRKYT